MRFLDVAIAFALACCFAACGFDRELGQTAADLNRLSDAGFGSPLPDGGCMQAAWDPLLPIAMGSQPEEAAWFIPAGNVNVATVGPGVTNVEHDDGDGWWLWLSFGEPLSDGELPRALGAPSCAIDDARLFAPHFPDGGGEFVERALHAHLHVVDAGTDAGDAIELELTNVSYDDLRGPKALPDIHIHTTLMPWAPPWANVDGGS